MTATDRPLLLTTKLSGCDENSSRLPSSKFSIWIGSHSSTTNLHETRVNTVSGMMTASNKQVQLPGSTRLADV